MKVTVASTAESCEGWLLEVEVEPGTTVAQLKKLLAGAPHLLAIVSDTKVLGRLDGQLVTLYDDEKVHSYVTLLNVNADKLCPFPEGFIWGSATAAYQIEGAAEKDGRSQSIWDSFCRSPGKIQNGHSGKVACDHYHRFREDVKLMKKLDFHAYRFSISWPRLLPKGRGQPNPQALAFYGALLDELLSNGIQPFVTLYHWDLPQCLQDEYGGWLSSHIIEDFENYAAVCFEAFGTRVKRWMTLNEPWCVAVMGYATGEHAPGRSEAPEREPYLAAHNMILAHAQAVRCYREHFQDSQNGLIGMAINMDWKEKLTDSEADTKAQQRALDWQLGWFADPVYRGDYPESMRKQCMQRLPSFSQGEKELIRGSADFFGLNHYSTDFVSADERRASESSRNQNYFNDSGVKNTSDPHWAKTDMGWDIVPWGLRRLLEYIQKEYNPPGGIFISENGYGGPEDVEKAKSDSARVEYLQGYLAQLYQAVAVGGVNVRGYFVWSLMDNFEWAYGYNMRFGVVRVDFETQERTPKASAALMSEVAMGNVLKVPRLIWDNSHYAPYNGVRYPVKKSAEHAPAETKSALTVEDAQELLMELASRYQAPEFQAKMIEAYKAHLINNDDIALMKQRRLLCMPIQAAVLPKFGFEPTTRGVAKAMFALSQSSLNQDTEVLRLNQLVTYLTRELPHKTSLEGTVG